MIGAARSSASAGGSRSASVSSRYSPITADSKTGASSTSSTGVLPSGEMLMAPHPHPQLQIEVSANNEFANLIQRDADIAIRATPRPPPHWVGRHLGLIEVAVFAASRTARNKKRLVDLSTARWVAVDDALPEHPSVRWRRRHCPQAVPRVLVNNAQSVFEGIVAGAGIGVLPLFLARRCQGLVSLSDALDECKTQLWLLTHPESRHLRRIAMVAAHLASSTALR